MKTETLLYPGAPVLLKSLKRDGVEGDVRVQKYDETHFRVASFLPGVVVELPGDTAKIEPEKSQWVYGSIEEAQEFFVRFIQEAEALGWVSKRNE